jgi:hypothetical protein
MSRRGGVVGSPRLRLQPKDPAGSAVAIFGGPEVETHSPGRERIVLCVLSPILLGPALSVRGRMKR